MSEMWRFLTTASSWWGPAGIFHRLVLHLWVCAVAVTVAAVIAVPLAVALARTRRGAFFVAAVANAGRSVPTLAILGLAAAVTGIGFVPTMLAMTVLAIPPLFATTHTGMTTIDRSVLDAADGIGLTRRQRLTTVELPLAAPIMLTGLRIAVLQVVATATLGALVGFVALGSFLEEGRTQPDYGKLLGGSALVIALALLLDAGLIRWQRRAQRWRRDPRSPADHGA